MKKNAPQPILAADLPVRHIEIFGHGLVVPKDTLCMVGFEHDVDFFYPPVSDGKRYGKVTITIVVQLRHTYFEDGHYEIKQTLFSRSNYDTPWLKTLFPKSAWDGVTNSTGLQRIKSGRAWQTMRKKIQYSKIRGEILNMFLEGNVTFERLERFVPK
jgi:hypothetical protein